VEKSGESDPDLRGGLSQEKLEALLVAESLGTVVGPICVDGEYVLAQVVSCRQAKLDDETRTAIAQILFDKWLAEKRSAANVNWCWGTAESYGKRI